MIDLSKSADALYQNADALKGATAAELNEKTAKKSESKWDGDTLNAENFKRYLKLKGYELKYNTVLHSIEYRGISGIAAEHLDNDFPLVCYDELHRELKRVNPKICGQYVKMIANQNEYNPVIDALSRTKWDGIDRLQRLYEVMGIPDDDTLSRVFMRKWMMQGIALQHNTLDAAISTELVLILYGAQNIGKTSLLRKLAISPALFREGHQLNPSDKDSLSQGVSSFICELGELARTMKKDPDTLKAFFTLPADKWRSPYAASPETHPRRTIFAGTVNDERFLVDPTGNRRFAVIQLDNMDYRKVLAMSSADILQLWAQINADVENVVKHGGNYAGCFRLTPEERQMQESRNNRFMKLTTAQSEVEDILASVEMNPNAYKWKDATVLEWQSYFGCLSRYTPESVGKALTAAGIAAQKPKRVNGKATRLRKLPFPIRKPSMINVNGHTIEEAPVL